MNDEDLLKAMKNKGAADKDVDDELAALEEEMNGPKKSKKKKKNDDDLSLSDISDDEEEKKNTVDDIYPEKVEEKYHNIKNMISLGVLKEETELCDKIIEYKKKLNIDYDTWEIKKESLDQKSKMITASIEDGAWDFDTYKKKIGGENQWENKLLQFCEKDPSLSPAQKNELKKRVEKRMAIIKQELEQQIEEEEEPEPEQVAEQPNETPQKQQQPEIKKQESKEVNDGLIRTTTHTIQVPKEKEPEEIKRLTQLVTDRLNEYRAALEYFKTNGLSEQQAPCIESAKKICRELKKIQDGNWKAVDEFALPDPITPTYIYGYSNDERKKKFTKIITEIFNQKKEVSENLQKKLEALKKLPKSKLQKIQNVVKKDLDAMRTRKEKFEKILSLLKLKFQDKWVPAPLFVENQEEIKVEKINNEIPENCVKMIIGKTDYKKDKLTVIVKLVEAKGNEVTYESKPKGDLTKEIDWKLEKGDFKSFFRKGVIVELYEKGFLGIKNNLKGVCKIEPRGLKNHLELTEKFPIEMEDKKDNGPKLEVSFKLRTPCHEPEYTTETKTVFNITKIFPPFKGENKNEAAITMPVNTPKVTPQDLKVNSGAPQKKPPQTTAPQKIATPQQNPQPVKKGPPIDKSKFSEEELKDPDCIDALNTLEVLEFKHSKYEAIRAKIDGRTPRELMQKIIKIKCKINVLNDSLGDSIGPEDYLTLLKNTYAHDRLLAEYFAQQNDAEKAKLVNERLPLLVKETGELKQQMGLK